MRKVVILFICIVQVLSLHSTPVTNKCDSLLVLSDNYLKANNPSKSYELLKEAFAEASYLSDKNVSLNKVYKCIQDFLTHISIDVIDKKHNYERRFICRYDSLPLTAKGTFFCKDIENEIVFVDGLWIDNSNAILDNEFRLSVIDSHMPINKKNKRAQSLLKKTQNEYTFTFTMMDKKKELFYVKDENLYYAAILSSEIPEFDIASDHSVLNLASCVKAILKASGTEAKYEDIIHNFLHTTIDEQYIPTTNYGDTIANRKVIVETILHDDISSNLIVNELLYEKFAIAIDKEGNASLITAIAFTEDKLPVHVRMRLPSQPKGKQKVQVGWNSFIENTAYIIKISII